MQTIVQEGVKVLRETAKPVPEKLFGSDKLTKLVADMAEALDAQPEGVALAAPQVGVSYRFFIVRIDRTLPPTTSPHPSPEATESAAEATKDTAQLEVFINPEIVKSSRRRVSADEGCLSVKGVYGTTKRRERVTIRARRADGTKFERGAGGLLAQIFQHEIDHLNGILFIDHAKNLLKIRHDQPHNPQHSQTSEGTPFRFIFFGTPKVASETLATLIARGFTPALVVSSPDAPVGRGLTLTPSPVKTFALSNNIPVLTPEKLDEKAIAEIIATKADYAVVVAYGKIFPQTLIGAFPLGVLNVHYSLLPKYRGATPLEAALLVGEAETGVTIQKMAFALDAGDIIAQSATPIGVAETAKELRPRLIALGAELLAETIPLFQRGEITPVSQPTVSPTPHTRKLKKEDGLLSLDTPAIENWNKYRAYADSIGTYFYSPSADGEKRIKITSASFKNGEFIIERVIPEGKREMAYH